MEIAFPTKILVCSAIDDETNVVDCLRARFSCTVFRPGEAAADLPMPGAACIPTALILADARSRNFTLISNWVGILALSGVGRIVLAATGMEGTGFGEEAFTAFTQACERLGRPYGLEAIPVVPITAFGVMNVAAKGQHTPWYHGPTLAELLESPVAVPGRQERFRLPVSEAKEVSPGEWEFSGEIACGEVAPGMAVRVLPGGARTRIRQVLACDVPQELAAAGTRIRLTLADPIAADAGDVIAAADSPPEVADQFEATLLWLSDSPLLPGRAYAARIHAKEVIINVTAIKYRKQHDTEARLAARTVGNGEVAVVNIATDQPVAFESHASNPVLGGITVFELHGRKAVGIGSIDFALRRASNIHWQALEINKQSRAGLKHQKPACVWFTGLSGSGKSTIANALEKRLFSERKHTYLLDGDNVRHGLNRDLGFSEADRVENIRRVAEVAKLMVDAGLIVLVSFISPFRSERQLARSLFAPGEFVEVFVDTPLSECERRDPKGLYAKARRGELKNFTGIDSDYEAPESPEIHLRSPRMSPEECADVVLDRLLDA